jgi:hypothetical protein
MRMRVRRHQRQASNLPNNHREVVRMLLSTPHCCLRRAEAQEAFSHGAHGEESSGLEEAALVPRSSWLTQTL